MGLNYYAINRVLGARMVAGPRARFGRFATLENQAGALRHRLHKSPNVELSRDKDRIIVQAFEDVREGASPDRLLWDTRFAAKFHRQCRRLGVHAPGSALTRRIITIRKSATRYAAYGIKISSSQGRDSHPSIVPQYAHAIEFALVRLRYRHGASIDDILIDKDLGKQFEAVAGGMVPGVPATDLRLGALYIRKSRFVAKSELTLFDELDAARFEHELVDSGTLATASALPAEEGLFELVEPERYLYITRTENLRLAVAQLAEGPALGLMGNHFWTPDRSKIRLRIYVGADFLNTSLQKWQLKLILEREPVFNWPVISPRDAA